MISKALKIFGVSAFVALMASLPGCTTRSITITTNPPGAEVSINHRVIGLSPVRVGFTHYGTYRIEIRMEKYQTLVKEECVNPPLYGYEPVSFVTDNAIPARLNDDLYLHYVLKAEDEVGDRAALLDRANMARQGVITKADGTQINVAYTVPPKTPEQLTKAAQKAADAKAAAAPAPAANSDGTAAAPAAPVNPVDQFKVKPITAPEPEGPQISKDLNIKPATPPADKKPDAPKPDASKEPKKEPAPKGTSKTEELIFDKPETPKTDAPKPAEEKK